MLNINTNYAAAFAANAAKKTSSSLDTAVERLSSGSRINFARDDSAGLAIATRLQAEVQSISVAARNAADAQSMLDTADGALGEALPQYLTKNARISGTGVKWYLEFR